MDDVETLFGVGFVFSFLAITSNFTGVRSKKVRRSNISDSGNIRWRWLLCYTTAGTVSMDFQVSSIWFSFSPQPEHFVLLEASPLGLHCSHRMRCVILFIGVGSQRPLLPLKLFGHIVTFEGQRFKRAILHSSFTQGGSLKLSTSNRETQCHKTSVKSNGEKLKQKIPRNEKTSNTPDLWCVVIGDLH